MTLKKKLTLGLGFLFLIIFVLGIFCFYYIGKLSEVFGSGPDRGILVDRDFQPALRV
jgi:hypothetical protein